MILQASSSSLKKKTLRGSRNWGGDSSPLAEPQPQSMAPKLPSLTLKPLFLSQLSDLPQS